MAMRESDDDEGDGGSRWGGTEARLKLPAFLAPAQGRAPPRMGIMQPHPCALARRQRLEARAGKASSSLLLQAYSFGDVAEGYFNPVAALQRRAGGTSPESAHLTPPAQRKEKGHQQPTRLTPAAVGFSAVRAAAMSRQLLQHRAAALGRSTNSPELATHPARSGAIAGPPAAFRVTAATGRGAKGAGSGISTQRRGSSSSSGGGGADPFVPLAPELMRFHALNDDGLRVSHDPIASGPRLEREDDPLGNYGSYFKARRFREERQLLRDHQVLLPPRFRPPTLSVQDPWRLPQIDLRYLSPSARRAHSSLR